MKRQEADGIVVLQLVENKIDASNAPSVKDRLNRELPGGGRVVIDLSSVEFMDSSGVGLLLHALRHMTDTGGAIKFAAPQPQVRKILEMIRFQHVADILPSTEECIRALHGG